MSWALLQNLTQSPEPGSLAMLLLGAEVLSCPLLSLPLCCGVYQIQMPARAFSLSSFPTQLMLRLQIF